MCVDIVRRLKLYMEHVGLPSTQFADYAKIARPTISQLLNGRNRKVSNELIEKLHYAFPDLNILWLMFGDGEMIVNNSVNKEQKKQHTLFDTPSIDVDSKQTTPRDAGQILQSLNLRRQNDDPTISVGDDTENDSTGPSIQLPVNNNGGKRKKIQTIMVCYTDNSFEIFTPAQ